MLIFFVRLDSDSAVHLKFMYKYIRFDRLTCQWNSLVLGGNQPTERSRAEHVPAGKIIKICIGFALETHSNLYVQCTKQVN